MKEQGAEQEESAGPGVVARTIIRGIDACIHVLQRLRARVAHTGDETAADGGRRDHAPARQDKHDKAEKPEVAEEVAARPHRPLLRRLSLGLLLLVLGGTIGGLLSWRSLSLQLAEHASVVERIQEELDATRKEDARNVKLMDKFQRENAEFRLAARDAQRQAENAKAEAKDCDQQVAQLRNAVDQARRQPACPPVRAASRTTRSAPPKTADCAAGTAGDVADCVEKFNR